MMEPRGMVERGVFGIGDDGWIYYSSRIFLGNKYLWRSFRGRSGVRR